jgi:transposase-like protein
VSDLNKKIYGTIEAWRNRPIEGEHPYVYPDGIVLSAPGLARCATCRFWWRSR